jgi:protein-tyrosine phosphatase
VIDLHCHVLAGIDDGPATLEDSLALARASASAGTRTIVATPHVSWEYRNRAETIARLVDELNGRLRSERVAVEVRDDPGRRNRRG